MKTEAFPLFVMSLILILNACSPLPVTGSPGQQPTAVEENQPASASYQPVTVDQVEVEVGVGSPIPVHIHVSGNLPDTCSQIEHTEIVQDGSNFLITLSATPKIEGCVPDSLPFNMSIPLNVVDLPAGSYSMTVNDARGEFQLEAGNSTASLRTADMPIVKQDIQVDSVNMEIGVGSPIPVHAVVSGNLPMACAQLGEVRVHREETTFFVRLVAYVPAQTDCQEDSLPFRLEVPLNIVNLPEGPYEVNVNGVTASFDPRAVPAKSPSAMNPIQVDHVEVQVGEGSPIPVEIIASGIWPDLCAQIAEVRSVINDFQIDVTVLASTVEPCPPDQLGLPFRFALPLNIVELPEGTYTVSVNGSTATFDIPVQ